MDNSDILSDAFMTLRLQSHLYFDAELRGDFSVKVPQEQRRIRFHLVHQGGCWVRVPGEEPVRLGEFELAIVPNGVEQTLSNRPDAEPVLLSALLENGACKDGVLACGVGDQVTRVLCGFCQFDEEIEHPLLANLPALMIVRYKDLGAEPWSAETIRLLALESGLKAQGTSGILSRLLEIILIQAMRRLSAEADAEGSGFVAALRDTRLSRALQAMHTEPETAWTIRDLAKLAGMSRGRFAQKFTQVVGTPPIDYLTNWRLTKARLLLATSNLDMTEIAQRCGYKSVPSFSRRFTRAFGIGPGSFRRTARGSERASG